MKQPLRSAPISFGRRLGGIALALLGGVSVYSCSHKEPAREAMPRPTDQPASRSLAPPNPEESRSKRTENAAPAPAPTGSQLSTPLKPAPGAPGAPPASGAVPPQAATKARARPTLAPERRAAGSAEDREADEKAKDGAGVPSSLLQRLDNAVNLNTPDCPSARERRKSICDLASQICRLVDRDPNVASVEGYCDDARQRCSEAERRTAERCDR